MTCRDGNSEPTRKNLKLAIITPARNLFNIAHNSRSKLNKTLPLKLKKTCLLLKIIMRLQPVRNLTKRSSTRKKKSRSWRASVTTPLLRSIAAKKLPSPRRCMYALKLFGFINKKISKNQQGDNANGGRNSAEILL